MSAELKPAARALDLIATLRIPLRPEVIAVQAVGPHGTEVEYREALAAVLAYGSNPSRKNLAGLRLAASNGETIPEPEEQESEPFDGRNPETGASDLRPRLRTVDFQSGVQFSPPSWIVKGVLPKQGIAVLFGESGAGKTFLAIHAALCVSTGTPFFGNRTKQGGVLYVAAEGGSSVIPRINAAAKRMAGERAPIRVVTEAPDLSRTGKPAALAATIDDAAADFEEAGSRLSLVVLDTWHAAMGGGDENSAADAGVALAPLREAAERHGALVLILHHPGKDTERGTRGSNALPAAADAIVAVTVPGHGGSVGKPSDAIRRAVVTKLRDGETGVELFYSLPMMKLGIDEDGDPWTTCVVQPVGGKPVVPVSPTVREFLTALDSVLTEGEGDRALMEAVRTTFYAGRPKAKPDTARRAFNRARDAALRSGRIDVDAGQDWVWKI